MNNKIKTTKLTYQELIDLVKSHKDKSPIFKIRVEHDPYGVGQPTELFAYIHEKGFLVIAILGQENINGDDYAFVSEWKYTYKGTFDFLGFLVPEDEVQNKKPKLLEIGDRVIITEEAKKCGDYDGWSFYQKQMIGQEYVIKNVSDTFNGVYYGMLEMETVYYFAHHYLKKIQEPEVKEMTVAELEKELGYKIKLVK